MSRRQPEIYLDHNATTRTLPAAAAAAHSAMESLFGNPSSSHTAGLRARNTLETGRNLCRRLLGADSGRIVFTSGATEAIQTAVFSALCELKSRRAAGPPPAGKRFLLYGATEHKAVPEALRHWNGLLGIDDEVVAIPVDREGQLDFAFLAEHAASADMVCTMAVNNETGVIHQLDRVEDTIRDRNPEVLWMVDYVQGLGKLDLKMGETTIDYAPCSGHKLYAPKGIGFLYLRDGAPLTPLLAGGGQESGARSGTENLPGIAALSAVTGSLLDPDDGTFRDGATMRGYRDRLAASLADAFPGLHFNAPSERAIPTTLNFSAEGLQSKELLDLFDAAEVRVSSGSACGSAVQGSYVLEAMGLEQWRCDSSIRVSFGPATTGDEIETACERIAAMGRALSKCCLGPEVADGGAAAADEIRDGLVQFKYGSDCSWVVVSNSSRNCIIVDPFEAIIARICNLVRCQRLNVLAVLDTHLHVDHESPRAALVEALRPFLAEGADPDDVLGFPAAPDGEATLGDGSRAPYLKIDDSLAVASTPLPGHTTVSQAYLVGELSDGTGGATLKPERVRYAFTGDNLLIGGIGRTDFPSSDVGALYESLQRLPRIVADTTPLCPTHDYHNGFCTTVGAEREHNALLRRTIDPVAPLSPDDFVAEKAVVDGGITDDTNPELVCGLIDAGAGERCEIDLPPGEAAAFFAEHRDAVVIDVREPHEHDFVRDWSAIGLGGPPDNIPLTRITGYVAKCLLDDRGRQTAEREFILLCRSGRRSGLAAQMMRRIGFKRSWNFAGGLALGDGDPGRGRGRELEEEYTI